MVAVGRAAHPRYASNQAQRPGTGRRPCVASFDFGTSIDRFTHRLPPSLRPLRGRPRRAPHVPGVALRLPPATVCDRSAVKIRRSKRNHIRQLWFKIRSNNDRAVIPEGSKMVAVGRAAHPRSGSANAQRPGTGRRPCADRMILGRPLIYQRSTMRLVCDPFGVDHVAHYVPGVSLRLPPATVCDRFAVKSSITVSNLH
jgi:hypothetical protein